MLVRFRALSGHRSTLASSVVASFDTDPMSGYGYGPTLTSSVVADGDCMSIRSLHCFEHGFHDDLFRDYFISGCPRL
jgi:hypothetical protein